VSLHELARPPPAVATQGVATAERRELRAVPRSRAAPFQNPQVKGDPNQQVQRSARLLNVERGRCTSKEEKFFVTRNRARTRTWKSAPARPALPYYGSKFRLYSWIREFLAPHTLYCEPFGGSAAVLLRKEPARVEVFNDLDAQVVNFFRVLRDKERREELIALLQLTPYSKGEYVTAHETSGDPTLDGVERARRLFIRGWQGYGPGSASTDRKTGWARAVPPSFGEQVRSWLGAIPNLEQVAARLRNVQIEHDTAWSVLGRYDSAETLFYVDPPYVESTLSANKPYRHGFSETDHRRLAKLLDSCEGMVLLSGFDSPLYEELFGHWERHEKRALTVGRGANGRAFRTEVLWLNRHLAAKRSEPAA
jgi:DNA adenine methylase